MSRRSIKIVFVGSAKAGKTALIHRIAVRTPPLSLPCAALYCTVHCECTVYSYHFVLVWEWCVLANAVRILQKQPFDYAAYTGTVFDNYLADVKQAGEDISFNMWDTAGREDYGANAMS